MTALRFAHALALRRAIAHVYADDALVPAERAAILTLLLACTDDRRGDQTLDALSAIFEDHDTALSDAVVEAFAQLTNACHALGQASSCSDASERKPRVTLVGHDGNAFAILGRCQNAAHRARWNVERWEAFRTEAT